MTVYQRVTRLMAAGKPTQRMKLRFVLLAFCCLCCGQLRAQRRFSVAPAYWFQHNPYQYQVYSNFNGLQSQMQATGFNTVSSVGGLFRYRFATRWDVAAGGLYTRTTNHIQSPQSPYWESSFTSKGIQFPVLISYRLTAQRLSPYFSAGALFTKSTTFTSPVQTDGLIGAGVDYQFGPNLSLVVQPTASYSFSPPVNNTVYQFTDYRSYIFGLQAQVVCHF